MKKKRNNKLEINLHESHYKYNLNRYFSVAFHQPCLMLLCHRGINIYISKCLLINTTLNDNMNKLQNTPVNMVNANSLKIDTNGN